MKSISFLCASVLILAGLASTAQAEIGVGVIGSYHLKDGYTVSGPYNESISSQTSSSFGALGFFPVFPWFSLRVGAIYEQLNFQASSLGSAATATRVNNLLIPLNLQFDLPASDVYFFGGAIFDMNQSSNPDTGSKWQNDTRINLGVGYNFVDFLGIKLSAEIEDQIGTHSIAPNSNFDMKTNSADLNLMARFTF